MRAVALALVLTTLPLFAARPQAALPCDSTRWHQDCSTPGVQLTLVEQMREKVRRDIVVGYGLTARGLPAGRIYTLWVRPSGGDPQPLETGFTPDSSGAVICADSAAFKDRPRITALMGWCDRGLDKVGLTAGQFVRGEVYRAALISTDDSVRAYATAVPHPLAATSGGCTVTAEVLSPQIFAFWGAGFRPGETLHVTSRSGGDTKTASETADESGRLAVRTVIHNERGKRGGEATYEVAGAACQVMLRYGWGNKVLGPGT